VVHEARSEFIKLRYGSRHGGTWALLRADEDDSRGKGEILHRKSTNTQKFRSGLENHAKPELQSKCGFAHWLQRLGRSGWVAIVEIVVDAVGPY
jgi:hypothetical protein